MLALCNGTIGTGPDGQAICSVPWQLSVPFDISQLDIQALLGAFSAGFIIVGSIWVVAHAAALIVKFIGE